MIVVLLLFFLAKFFLFVSGLSWERQALGSWCCDGVETAGLQPFPSQEADGVGMWVTWSA
jgi:hypothetical protein